MAYEQRNKATIRTKQNLIDISIQKYGTAEALFKVIDNNPTQAFTIDSVLDGLISEKIFTDNQTEQETELIKKFDLENRIIVNEDDEVIIIETGDDYSDGYSDGYS